MVEHFIENLAHGLGHWAYLLVALSAMAETAAFLGFIAPGEFAIILGGVLAGEGALNIWLLIGIAWTACVIGDSIGFTLGRKLGRNFALKHGHRVRLTEERLGKVEAYFHHHGGKTIVIGRWLGLIRPLMPFTAGTSGMSFRRFLPYDVLGAGAWSVTFTLLGYFFWQSFTQLQQYAGLGALAFGLTLVVFVGGYQAIKRLRKPAERRRLAAWLERQGERPLLRPVAAVVRALGRLLRPVWRYALAPLWRLIAPPLRFLIDRVTPGGLGIELTTLLAIAVVSIYTIVLQVNLIEAGSMPAGDTWGRDLANEAQTSLLTGIAKVVTFFGKSWVVALAVLATSVLLLLWRRGLEAGALVAGFITAEVAQLVLKEAVERSRPEGGLAAADGFSYPSGHATLSVAYLAIAVVLARAAPLTMRVALIVSGLVATIVVGLSRAYLQVHWLSDVGGGWAVGLASYSICGMIALVAGYVRLNWSDARAATAPGREAARSARAAARDRAS